MKAEILLDMERVNPEFDFELARLAHESGEEYDVPHSLPCPKGTIIDDPKCFILVRAGCAIPADEQCEKKANVSMAEKDVKKRLARYIKTTKGMATGMKKYDAKPPKEDKSNPKPKEKKE